MYKLNFLLVRYLHPLAFHFIIYYQPHSPKDERIVSPNRSPDAAITGPSSNSSEAPRSSGAAADNNAMYPPNNYGSLEQTYFYGGWFSILYFNMIFSQSFSLFQVLG